MQRLGREKYASNRTEEEQMLSRRVLEALTEDELWDTGVAFSNPICRNEAQHISLKAAKEMALSKADKSTVTSSMTIMFAAATFLRKSILSSST